MLSVDMEKIFLAGVAPSTLCRLRQQSPYCFEKMKKDENLLLQFIADNRETLKNVRATIIISRMK